MVFSHGSFGEFAFSAAEFTEIDDSAFLAFLADVTAPREWLLEIDALSLAESSAFTAAFSGAPFGVLAFSSNAGALEGGAVTLYFSTGGYISRILETVENVHAGTAQSGGVDTLELATGASAADDHYNGMTLELVSGAGSVQEREIVDYDGTTKVATVSPRWATNEFQRSNELTNAYWTKSVNIADLGDGWFTVEDDNVAGWEQIGRSLAVDAGDDYVLSVEIKKTPPLAYYPLLRMGWTGGTAKSNGIGIDTNTGQILAKDTVTGSTIHVEETDDGEAWRIWIKNNSGDNTSISVQFYPAVGPTPLASGFLNSTTGSLDIRKFQFEKASDVGAAYIETTSAAITLPDNTTAYEIPCDPIQVAASDPDSATWYPGNLTSEITIERSVLSGALMSGLSRVFGEVKLANPGGELDNLVRDYALDGRPARLYIGRPTDRRADFGLVFSGVIARTPEGNLNEISIALSDGVSKLEQSIQATVYAGTGGLEGGADLAGKPKPLAFGEVLNVAPPLVDSTKLIYQAHDGPVQDIPDVYDRGVALTRGADYSSQSDLETTAPAAGTFRVWPAGGYFRLGAAPDGTVTCNVEGDASGAGYVDTHADILLRILVDYAALFSTEIEPGSFSRLNTAAPGACGIWIGTDVRQISAVVDEILISAGAFGGFSRLGVFTVGQVDTPGGIVHGEITAEEISELERLPLPADLEPVIWRSSLGYQRNFTVQSDLAASVPAARVAFAAQEYRVVSQSDETIKSRRLLARDLVAPSLYVNQADADTENARRFALWSSPRTPYRAAARPTSLPRELGQDVVMTHNRYGLAAGRFGRVIGHRVSAINTEVELTVLI
jgi:hypothetical protein